MKITKKKYTAHAAEHNITPAGGTHALQAAILDHSIYVPYLPVQQQYSIVCSCIAQRRYFHEFQFHCDTGVCPRTGTMIRPQRATKRSPVKQNSPAACTKMRHQCGRFFVITALWLAAARQPQYVIVITWPTLALAPSQYGGS